jgi:RNA polymerase-binding transcription factor DksA
MKLICTHCKEFKKKKDTIVHTALVRIKLSNLHSQERYRTCKACGNEIWDAHLERLNVKEYIKRYKRIQKQQEKENGK